MQQLPTNNEKSSSIAVQKVHSYIVNNLYGDKAMTKMNQHCIEELDIQLNSECTTTTLSNAICSMLQVEWATCLRWMVRLGIDVATFCDV